MAGLYDEFTREEIKWIKVIEDGERKLEEYKRQDITKMEIATGRNFITFLEKIIKYENLRLNQEYNVRKRKLIRVKRMINKKELDKREKEYVISGGIYIVADVYFIDPEITKRIINNHGRVTDDMIIPEDAMYNSIKLIKGTNGEEIGVCLAEDSLFDEHNIGMLQSSWDYAYFV